MEYVWHDYNPKTMWYIESWLDENAIQATGLDEGFNSFYEYWANEDGFTVGENFWCKVVFEMTSRLLSLHFACMNTK